MIAAALALAGAFGTPASAVSANTGYEWFWSKVPARIDQGSRLGAMTVIRDRSIRSKRPANERLGLILTRWGAQIEVAAHAARVSEALLAAVVSVESAGRSDAVSPVGARGLGQLMPGTAQALGVRDSFHPLQNLRGAALYLSDLLDMFDGDVVLALAAYNAGEGAVMRHRGVPPYAETRAYVPKVLEVFVSASDLCAQDSPMSARAACRLAP